MLVSAAEPVLQATSSSLLAFVACNLLIFVILVVSRFGGSRDARTMEALPVFGIHRDVKWVEIPDVEPFPSGQIVRSSCHGKQREEKMELVCEAEINREGENEDNDSWECTHEEEKGEDDGDTDGDNGEEYCDDFDGDGYGADELKRRIEDFIAKVNREWAAEKLMEGLQPQDDEPLALVMTSATAVC